MTTTASVDVLSPGSVEGRSARLWILIGAVLFIVALIGSAIVVPQLRLLHCLQAFIYVAVIILGLRNNPWAFGAGIAIAVVWNSLELFATHLIQTGAGLWWAAIRTGQFHRLDTMMVFVGGMGHFVLIAACAVAFSQLERDKGAWWRFAGGAVVALAYFGAIVAIALPR